MLQSPKIVHKPLAIDVLSYTEMRELSYAGFSVFPQKRFFLLLRKEFQCTCAMNNPEASGTYIMKGRLLLQMLSQGLQVRQGS